MDAVRPEAFRLVLIWPIEVARAKFAQRSVGEEQAFRFERNTSNMWIATCSISLAEHC